MTKFEEFWSAYPNKKGKGAAQKRYEKIDAETHKQIMLAIEAQKRCRAAAAKTGEWLPSWCMPSTWLSQSRHLDEIPSHAELKEKQESTTCCLEGCTRSTIGSRFPVCEWHYQFTKDDKLRDSMNLVYELRRAFNSELAIRPKHGIEALRWALGRLK